MYECVFCKTDHMETQQVINCYAERIKFLERENKMLKTKIETLTKEK